MRWYNKLFIGVGVLAAICLFIFFGLRIEHVKVEGTEIYTQEEIKQSVFTRKYSDNELFFMIYEKLYGINKLPFVEDIEVTFENRNTVTLRVYDKAISGCIKYMGQYVYFDKDGTVLQSMEEKKEGVPVVTGIKFGTFTVGKVFRVKDESLFATIMNLSQLITHYDIDVERLHMEEGNVVLYSGGIKVILGKKSLYDDEMSALSSVLDTAGKKKMKGTIDMQNFRVGDKIALKQDSGGKKKEKEKK